MDDWKTNIKETFEGLKARPQEREDAGEAGEAGEAEEEKAHLPDPDLRSKSAVAVIVVPCTRGAELAKRIREYEMVAKVQTGWFLKVVEKGGDPPHIP